MGKIEEKNHQGNLLTNVGVENIPINLVKSGFWFAAWYSDRNIY